MVLRGSAVVPAAVSRPRIGLTNRGVAGGGVVLQAVSSTATTVISTTSREVALRIEGPPVGA
jgi:hypothetical protein